MPDNKSMDWQSIKDALGDAIFGETRSLARKTAVGAGILGLVYYFMPPISDPKKPMEDTVVDQEIQKEWKSFKKNERNGQRAPASVGASDSIAFRTTQNSDKKNQPRSVSSSSRYTPPSRDRLPDMPPRYESEDEDRDWVPMSSYTSSTSSAAPSGDGGSDLAPSEASSNDSGDSNVADSGGSTGGGGDTPICCVVPSNKVGDEGEGVVDKDGDNDKDTDNDGDAAGSDSIACSVDKPEGVYGSSISVGISCSGAADIYYCVQTGGGSCDPSGGTLYSGPVALNLGDNIYDLSFYAKTSSYSTDIDSATYTIDSTLPDLVVDFPVIQSQTSEFPLVNTTTSADYGKTGNYYSQINLKSYNPGSASCRDIFDGYHLYSPTPTVIQGSTDVSPLNAMLDVIEQSLDLSNLQGGDNYIVTFMEDAERNLVSCQTQKVIVKDFHMAAFTGAGPTPVTAGGFRTIAGGFVSYGHFQPDPSTPTTSGSSTNTQGSGLARLVSGLWDVFY